MDKQRPEKEPIMATKLDNALKGQLSDQLAEVYRVTSNGTRDFSNVRKALQDIIEGKFPEIKPPEAAITHVLAKQPTWYVPLEQQLKQVQAFNAALDWGFQDSDFPAPPGFRPSDPNEVLLLVVSLPVKGRKPGLHRTFDELWNLIEAPDGYEKWRWDELKATTKLLRQTSGYIHTPGIRWVVFNPNAYHGKSPRKALELSKADNVQLAGTEVLMAALLFPDWATSWNGNTSQWPNLSGLQFNYDGDSTDWSDVPYLRRWDGARQLRLHARWADFSHVIWSSPSVREC